MSMFIHKISIITILQLQLVNIQIYISIACFCVSVVSSAHLSSYQQL